MVVRRVTTEKKRKLIRFIIPLITIHDMAALSMLQENLGVPNFVLFCNSVTTASATDFCLPSIWLGAAAVNRAGKLRAIIDFFFFFFLFPSPPPFRELGSVLFWHGTTYHGRRWRRRRAGRRALCWKATAIPKQLYAESPSVSAAQ
jgi:hypothetical protein